MLIPIVGTLAVFTAPVVIVFLVLMYKGRGKQQLHEERMAMIEKGIFDPALLTPPDAKGKKAPRAHRLMIWGIVLTMAGAGLAIMLVLDDGIGEVGPGILLAFIGLGMMGASRYVTKNLADEAPSDTSTPPDGRPYNDRSAL